MSSNSRSLENSEYWSVISCRIILWKITWNIFKRVGQVLWQYSEKLLRFIWKRKLCLRKVSFGNVIFCTLDDAWFFCRLLPFWQYVTISPFIFWRFAENYFLFLRQIFIRRFSMCSSMTKFMFVYDFLDFEIPTTMTKLIDRFFESHALQLAIYSWLLNLKGRTKLDFSDMGTKVDGGRLSRIVAIEKLTPIRKPSNFTYTELKKN